MVTHRILVDPARYINGLCKLCEIILTNIINTVKVKVKVKCSRYRPHVAQRVGRVIALLFHDRGTRGG